MPTVKEEARRLVEKLGENSTWDDLMHEIYVRQAIEAYPNRNPDRVRIPDEPVPMMAGFSVEATEAETLAR